MRNVVPRPYAVLRRAFTHLRPDGGFVGAVRSQLLLERIQNTWDVIDKLTSGECGDGRDVRVGVD